MWAFSFGSIILSLAHFNSIEMGFNIRGESKGWAHVVHHNYFRPKLKPHSKVLGATTKVPRDDFV